MMSFSLQSPVFSCSRGARCSRPSLFIVPDSQIRMTVKISSRMASRPFITNCMKKAVFVSSFTSVTQHSRCLQCLHCGKRGRSALSDGTLGQTEQSNSGSTSSSESFKVMIKFGAVLAAVVCGVLVFQCQRAMTMEGLVIKEQGLILAVLLGLSAFFSMAETSITTLWPWKVRELADKEPDNGVFRMLRSDVTRFLTTILIGTTVVNIAATALVTEAATAIFGEAGISAATGVMTECRFFSLAGKVAILLLTEITPKSIAVHHATDVARFVVRPVAWLSVILYPVGRVATFLSFGMLKMLGLKGRSEPYVTEDELKLMLRGAELSGAIEEEEQDMIENVLEIKDTHVREVMTPLVDVVAIDSSATLINFHELWVTHQYSRVPVFEERIDNIVGIAYAMGLLDYAQKGELLESSFVGDFAHKPAYFVPDSMSVWNLLREFRIRKVHMAVVINEYGGTVGIVTLEDAVEEIVGEIFDENDSKEEIRKKTGYILMRAEGIYDVDANTSIYDLSEELNMKLPEDHQYETVSGFVCEAFGYIPRTGESIRVLLERDNKEENDETESEHQDPKDKVQAYTLEILAANARKVSAVRFERLENANASPETKDAVQTIPNIVTKYRRSDNESANKYLQKVDENNMELSSHDNSLQESKEDSSLDLFQFPEELDASSDDS
ncbi:hypothetical protein V2J09_020493 [Rumex salicifolius]